MGSPGAQPQPSADPRAAAAQPELLQSGKVNKATDIYRRASSSPALACFFLPHGPSLA